MSGRDQYLMPAGAKEAHEYDRDGQNFTAALGLQNKLRDRDKKVLETMGFEVKGDDGKKGKGKGKGKKGKGEDKGSRIPGEQKMVQHQINPEIRRDLREEMEKPKDLDQMDAGEGVRQRKEVNMKMQRTERGLWIPKRQLKTTVEEETGKSMLVNEIRDDVTRADWQCTGCGTLNSRLRKHCTRCGASYSKLQELLHVDAKLQLKDRLEKTGSNYRLDFAQGKVNRVPTGWQCGGCKLINRVNLSRCLQCGESKMMGEAVYQDLYKYNTSITMGKGGAGPSTGPTMEFQAPGTFEDHAKKPTEEKKPATGSTTAAKTTAQDKDVVEKKGAEAAKSKAGPETKPVEDPWFEQLRLANEALLAEKEREKEKQQEKEREKQKNDKRQRSRSRSRSRSRNRDPPDEEEDENELAEGFF
ncbi:unnamed protein product [Amoebophrya sp. A120]|nr:unnamed protein product [Amoebophrya sp. A120]|eukprot:GSA120T00006587001.1